MSTDMIVSATLVPASEALSKIIEEIFETVKAAGDVLIEKESFAELSGYLGRIVPVLRELINKRITHGSESVNDVTQILTRQIKVAKGQVLECSKRNKVYLLLNCRRIVKQMQETTKEISRALRLIPLASLDLSSSINEEVSRLCDDMLKVEFKAAVAEERALERIESGLQERNYDRSYANGLLVLIAEAVGISTDRYALKREFDEFKREVEDAQVRKNQAEAIQMDQIIGLLGRADAALSPGEKEERYYRERNSLSNQPLEPLQPFYCPITQNIMVDPVETSSGKIFERSAIEKRLKDGNTTCPLTNIPLDSRFLRPNVILRKSIEEWKERNTMITICSLKVKLCSGEEQEVLPCLKQLQDLCEERDLHREWVALENYIPILVGFLRRGNPETKSRALAILHLLAMDSDDNKERIAEVENAIESIVNLLARSTVETKLVVALLLELSNSFVVLDRIGKVHGCILLLVTTYKSENIQAARDAKELLERLSFDNQNVVQMAKANYFNPLLQQLSSGSDVSKMIMATALAMELTDHSKAALFDDGVLQPLLHLISHGDTQVKQAAVTALKNLSSLPRNGLQMIREAAVAPLLSLLYLHIASYPALREQVAATIMNLAISATSPEAGETPMMLLESDDDIFRLFCLISLTGPNVQESILRTFHAICQPPSAREMRTKLRQLSAVQLLVQLCEQRNPTIRTSAVMLFFCLTVDGDDDTLAQHVDQRCLETLLMIVQTSHDEEKTAAMGIISNLPMDHTQITQWLLDAGALPIIFRFLADSMHSSSYMNHLVENASGALRRFTVSTNHEWQNKAAEAGIIPVLVQLLETGTSLTKQHAAISLAQFSESSSSLSRPVEKRRGFLCCSTPPEPGCPVHLGVCSVETSFCLVEAGAVQPLVRVLGDSDFGACRAALRALSTLIDGEKLQNGSKVLSEAKCIVAIIKLLSSPCADLQDEALHILERVFRLLEHKQQYGDLAKMPLVDITQRGSGTVKALAAQILAHLDVLPNQSSFF
ncbi:U-box domain-containing protein 44-like protein isoform X1 [Cinnamomum micranthum f. kanehirae]|uniref:RING-type E3 ubiquitin transferase n=1 Tax=Cinnamomum micranthum f. kanehirae TaxID=337451 RepID=A0A3S3MUW9_9MAGN|nr:U-box domain-containing protein 44-like protein isoform X1 [Cinnamomum micranthum f. kanehirae]